MAGRCGLKPCLRWDLEASHSPSCDRQSLSSSLIEVLARVRSSTVFTITAQAFEFRAGGVWRFVMHGPDGRDYQNRVTYDEIVPPERIVYRHGGGDDVEPVQFTTTVTFEALGNGRTRITWHGTFPSAAERARVIKEYGADKGLVQTMARLADYVAAMASAKSA